MEKIRKPSRSPVIVQLPAPHQSGPLYIDSFGADRNPAWTIIADPPLPTLRLPDINRFKRETWRAAQWIVEHSNETTEYGYYFAYEWNTWALQHSVFDFDEPARAREVELAQENRYLRGQVRELEERLYATSMRNMVELQGIVTEVLGRSQVDITKKQEEADGGTGSDH